MVKGVATSIITVAVLMGSLVACGGSDEEKEIVEEKHEFGHYKNEAQGCISEPYTRYVEQIIGVARIETGYLEVLDPYYTYYGDLDGLFTDVFDIRSRDTIENVRDDAIRLIAKNEVLLPSVEKALEKAEALLPYCDDTVQERKTEMIQGIKKIYEAWLIKDQVAKDLSTAGTIGAAQAILLSDLHIQAVALIEEGEDLILPATCYLELKLPEIEPLPAC